MPHLAEYLGLARSLRMYYGKPSQLPRMAGFYAQFIGPGELCFDVGAHVGSRVAPWLRLRARVVAVEPLPMCASLLRRLYGRSKSLVVVQAAVGAQIGQQLMLVNRRQPTISTLSPAWASRMQRERHDFAPVRWERSITVPVTTLDALIAQHGEPVFCKIDVEGYDLEVLRGLSRPLRALSFEHVPPAADATAACLHRLASLGDYQFNWSPGESMRLHWPAAWVSAEQVVRLVEALPTDANPGDVYARLRPP